MRINEIITDSVIDEELTFFGSPCTKNCGGHRAGRIWSLAKGLTDPKQCNSHSNSFNNGCKIAIQHISIFLIKLD